MKTRIISALVALIMLVAVIYFVGVIGIYVVASALLLIGMYEFYNSAEEASFHPLKWFGCVCGFVLIMIEFLVISNILKQDMLLNLIGCSVFALILILFLHVIFSERINIVDISVTLFGIIYVGFLFSFIILTANLDTRLFYLYMIFIGAWSTDTSAYFTGNIFGKTKLIERVSPNKTVEGSLGGIVGCILMMCIYGLISRRLGLFNTYVSFYHFAIIGALTGIISQIGDLAASTVKRFMNVKDYGSIMPGHGGVLDRFDSVLFVGPVIYFYFKIILGI